MNKVIITFEVRAANVVARVTGTSKDLSVLTAQEIAKLPLKLYVKITVNGRTQELILPIDIDQSNMVDKIQHCIEKSEGHRSVDNSPEAQRAPKDATAWTPESNEPNCPALPVLREKYATLFPEFNKLCTTQAWYASADAYNKAFVDNKFLRTCQEMLMDTFAYHCLKTKTECKVLIEQVFFANTAPAVVQTTTDYGGHQCTTCRSKSQLVAHHGNGKYQIRFEKRCARKFPYVYRWIHNWFGVLKAMRGNFTEAALRYWDALIQDMGNMETYLYEIDQEERTGLQKLMEKQATEEAPRN